MTNPVFLLLFLLFSPPNPPTKVVSFLMVSIVCRHRLSVGLDCNELKVRIDSAEHAVMLKLMHLSSSFVIAIEHILCTRARARVCAVRYTAIKHHWWWKIAFVFDHVKVLANHPGQSELNRTISDAINTLE